MADEDHRRPDLSEHLSDEMLDDYLQDRLPPEQRAEFEAYMMGRPALLEQAELGLMMREGFVALESGAAPAANPTASAQDPGAPGAGFRQWRLAAVASFLAIGVGFVLGNGLDRESGLLESQVVGFPITRSESPQALEATIRPDVDLVMLRIPLPDPESITYRVTISDDAGSIVDPISAQPDGGGVLNVAIDPERIPAGDYAIEIAHPEREGATLRIGFSVAP